MYDTNDAGDIADRSAVSAEIAERRQEQISSNEVPKKFRTGAKRQEEEQRPNNGQRAIRERAATMSRLSPPVKCQPSSDVEAACALQYTILHLFQLY